MEFPIWFIDPDTKKIEIDNGILIKSAKGSSCPNCGRSSLNITIATRSCTECEYERIIFEVLDRKEPKVEKDREEKKDERK